MELSSSIFFIANFDSEFIQTVSTCFNEKEFKYIRSLKHEKRRNSYSIGRYCAKKAVSLLTGQDNLKSILIDRGVFGFPVVNCPGKGNIQVSIAHCDTGAVAVSFPEIQPLAVDIEKIDQKRALFIKTQITEHERHLHINDSPPQTIFNYILWTAKEALGKILKTGFMVSFPILEISSLEITDANIAVCFFKNFSQYKSLSSITEEMILTIVLPKNTELLIPKLPFEKEMSVNHPP